MFLQSAVFILVLIGFVQQICAQSQDNPNSERRPQIKILKSINNRDENGYQFEYESQDGTHREESGEFVEADGKLILYITGSYSYIDPEGHEHVVNYEADDEGTKIGATVIPSLSSKQKNKDKHDEAAILSDFPTIAIGGPGLLNSLARGK